MWFVLLQKAPALLYIFCILYLYLFICFTFLFDDKTSYALASYLVDVHVAVWENPSDVAEAEFWQTAKTKHFSFEPKCSLSAYIIIRQQQL